MPGVSGSKWRRTRIGFLGPLLRRGDPGRLPGALATYRRALIIRPQKIGDLVATLPTVDALRAHAPRLEIDLMAGPRSGALVQGDPRFAKVFVFRRDRHGVATAWRARSRNYDLVLDLIDGDSVTALLLSQRCSGPHALRLGVRKVRHAPYYDGNTTPQTSGRLHAIDRTADVLSLLDIPATAVSFRSPPHVAEPAAREVTAFLASIAASDTRPRSGISETAPRFVGINLSAGGPTRQWPDDRFEELARRILLGNVPVCVILITDPREADRGDRLERSLQTSETAGRIARSPRDWSIQQVSGLLSHLDLLVSPDTSLLHIARSFGVNVVGLYPNSPWNIERWMPYGQADGVITAPGGQDIFDLRVDPVFHAVCRQLGLR